MCFYDNYIICIVACVLFFICLSSVCIFCRHNGCFGIRPLAPFPFLPFFFFLEDQTILIPEIFELHCFQPKNCFSWFNETETRAQSSSQWSARRLPDGIDGVNLPRCEEELDLASRHIITKQVKKTLRWVY